MFKLPPGDPFQTERYTQTKSQGMERYFMQMEKKKKARVAAYVQQNRL